MPNILYSVFLVKDPQLKYVMLIVLAGALTGYKSEKPKVERLPYLVTWSTADLYNLKVDLRSIDTLRLTEWLGSGFSNSKGRINFHFSNDSIIADIPDSKDSVLEKDGLWKPSYHIIYSVYEKKEFGHIALKRIYFP